MGRRDPPGEEPVQATTSWGQAIITLGPEVAEDLRRSAKAAAEEWNGRQNNVKQEVSATCGDLFTALRALCFGLEQHGLWMLKRIDSVAEDAHTPVRSALALLHSASVTGWLAGRMNILLVAPGRHAGLTPDDLSAVTDWIDTHTATPSLSSRGATGATRPTLTDDAHPCEGTGSDPQDFLPDDRAWGSRTPPPSRP